MSLLENDIYSNEIMTLLANKYNNNPHYYQKAIDEIHNKHNIINKIDSIHNHDNKNCCSKSTHIDLVNNTASIHMSNSPDALLAYNLEFLTVRRIFPYSLNTFLNINKDKDLKKAKTYEQKEEALKIIQWVKDRVINTQFSLANISLDKQTGVFKYNTNMLDQNYGPILQYMTCKMDANRIYQIPGTNEKGKIIDMSHDYYSLFGYFMAFGFTEFYAKCTCYDYLRKYSKRNGIMNYFCPHILYSMAQLPYYLIYALR